MDDKAGLIFTILDRCPTTPIVGREIRAGPAWSVFANLLSPRDRRE